MWSIGAAIKRSEALTHTIIWMSLENIILSEVSQTQGKIPYDCTYVKYLALAKLSRQKVRGMGCRVSQWSACNAHNTNVLVRFPHGPISCAFHN